jgi:hypothetical protein
MHRCIAFPYCTEQIPDTDIACLTCWRKIPKKLRNEAAAVHYRWPHSSKLYAEVMDRVYKHLVRKFTYMIKRRENIARFTVVPPREREKK